MSETVPSPQARHAWRQVSRQDPPARSARERLGDFLETHGMFDEATAREQASRCVQCPNPTCVSGCPLCHQIPAWMRLTAEGHFLEAAEVLGRNGSLVEICARLCPAEKHCEHNCILDGVGEAVSIAGLERFLSDYAARHQVESAATAPPNGRRVAVTGSGPGGLACADELAAHGCAVTIFDEAAEAGGLLTRLVPSFRVEDAIIERRLNLMRKRGVKFSLGAEKLTGVRLEALREDYDAVFLAVESRAARALPIPGAVPPAVMSAEEFITRSRQPDGPGGIKADLNGKRVVVIGGGDTAMDCARVALRQGARAAECVYRRGEYDLPCTCLAYREALEEGVQFTFRAAPVEIIQHESGRARTLKLVKTEPDDLQVDGRPGFAVVSGTEFELAADLVVTALGFTPKPLAADGELARLNRNEWGGLVVNESLMTNLPGVFAGGDVVRGPVKVITAVKDGKIAANGMLAWFRAR